MTSPAPHDGAIKPSEMTSLAERAGYLQALRGGFAVVVVAVGLLASDLIGVPVRQVLVATMLFALVSAGIEGLRRLIGSRGLPLLAINLMVDGIYLAWVAHISGGGNSPMRFLVFIHLITVTILASYRSGLKIALWHSMLIFGVVYLENLGLLDPVPTPLLPDTGTPDMLERTSVFNIVAFWAIALGAAAVSSINEKELRRRKLDYEGLATMAAELENLTDASSIASLMLERVTQRFGFSRGVVLGWQDEKMHLLSSTGDKNPITQGAPDEIVERAWSERAPILVRGLDEGANPVLAGLLPEARNVMVMPLVAEGLPVGVLVVEKPQGRARISRQAVTMTGQFASHGALALRNCWLMAKVQKLAETDPLTGVANRRVFSKTLERELARATRNGDQVTLVMFDVDHFKSFNDTYGHQAGDDVLRGVADAITATLRQFDTAARYGGEEFAVILPECSTEESGLTAERLREAIGRVQGPRAITASAGAATFPVDATNPEALIRAADEAMYASKEAGRDRVTLFRRLAEGQKTIDVDADEQTSIEVASGRWSGAKRGEGEHASAPSARAVALARAGATLTAAQETSDIYRSILDSAVNLVERSDAQVVVASGDATRMQTAAVHRTPAASGSDLELDPNDDPIAAALMEQRSVEGSLPGRRIGRWALGSEATNVFAIPFVVQQSLQGCLVVGTPTTLSEEAKYALEALMAKATAALERLAISEDLQSMEKRFSSLIQRASDVISVIELDGSIRYQTPSIERLLGYRADEHLGDQLTDLVHPDDISAAVAFLSTLANEADQEVYGEWRMRRRDGGFMFVGVQGRNLMEDQHVRGLVLTIGDLTERKELEQELTVLASQDPLTRLANRSFFIDHLEASLATADAEGDPLAVLLLNLDDFKVVNDSLGPEAGDELIVQVAERLRQCLRLEDSLARLGGDEFAILLQTTRSAGGASNVAHRLLSALQGAFRIRRQEMFVGATIGIAMREGHETATELLRNADVALHMAKSVDKGKFRVFEPSMHQAAVERLALTSDLQRAIENDELYLDFQPIVDMGKGHLVGVEALVRWTHPTRGRIGPVNFIPLAEETGLILPLGRWVMEKAFRQAEVWNRSFGPHPLRLSFNLSAVQLHQPGFISEVADLIERHDVEPSLLVFEITESVLLQDLAAATARLNELKELGVRLALDDFGTGYSSLSYLRLFPVDILKIDRSFVEGADSSAEHAALLDAIMRIGKSLNMTTVAEGIETHEQVVALRALGCDLAQGYFFSRPVAPSEIESMLTSRAEIDPVI
ncbi:MAG TPA: diguanylate cyclase [Actinomycetota bacterium]|nr:diguanylate cyclase [Actinomycetota bacterium]